MKDHQEVKEWYAIANYLQSFEQLNGVPQVPAYYNQMQNRKVVESNANLFAVLKNPNGFIVTVYAIILVFVGVVVLLARFIVRRKRRKNWNRESRTVSGL